MTSNQAVKLIKEHNTVVLTDYQFDVLWGDKYIPNISGKGLWDEVKLDLNKLSNVDTTDVVLGYKDIGL